MIKKSHAGKFLLTSILMLSALGLSSCGQSSSASSSNSAASSSQTSQSSQGESTSTVVNVKEIKLTLSKNVAKVGEHVTASVVFKPTNVTNTAFTLSSGDTTIATIENNEIVCVTRGTVTITARSNENPLKKSEATLTVLGTDDQGRSENIFEAEDANLVKTEGSHMAIGAETDERISGLIVGSLSKNDRMIWGINSSEADTNASLHITLMGPSGWGGMWNSIDYNFADWYTIKVNGHTVNTEDINVEGTYKNLGTADYFNVQDVTIGNIDLIQGTNVVTFVVSNRFDTTHVYDDKYSGAIGTLGNVDKITVYSTKTLTAVANTAEVEGADPDVILKADKLEVESDKTRVYQDEENPLIDMTGKTSVELKKDLNVMYGITAAKTTKVKLNIRIAAPYVDEATKMADVALNKILTINIGGKDIDMTGLTIKGNDKTGVKDNYCDILTGWVDLEEGNNIVDVVVNHEINGYAYLGALDYIEVKYPKGDLTYFLNGKPAPKQTFTFEAEAETTKRVGYDALEAGATYVELKDATKVQTDKYNNKKETTKIIYGIESSTSSWATISMRMSTPYLNKTTAMTDTGIGGLGDLWFNGTLVSTPNIIAGNNKTGVKDNFTEFTVSAQVRLTEGKNRIVWEPYNYSLENEKAEDQNHYEFLGAMDYIKVTTPSVLSAYKVNMYADRNTYFDSTGKEPIYVTVDSVASSSSWVGLWHTSDDVESKNSGSLYWFYPSSTGLGTKVDVTTQNPHDKRHLIDGLQKGQGDYTWNDGDGYGAFQIVYMDKDSANAAGGYDITDVVYISVWNDLSLYGGAVVSE